MMKNEDQIKLITNLLAPILLVSSPALLFQFANLIITSKDPTPFGVKLGLIGAPIGTFVFSFWYCRSRLGWFRRKPR